MRNNSLKFNIIFLLKDHNALVKALNKKNKLIKKKKPSPKDMYIYFFMLKVIEEI